MIRHEGWCVQNNNEGEPEQFHVQVATDDEGAKSVTIMMKSPAATEEAAPAAVEMSAGLLTKLQEHEVATVEVTAEDTFVSVNVDVQAIADLLDESGNSMLVIEVEDMEETVVPFDEEDIEKYDMVGSPVSVTIMIVNEDGSETVLSADSNVTVRLELENNGTNTVILFIDASGKAIETNAVWVEATPQRAGYWEVPYMGEGIYVAANLK